MPVVHPIAAPGQMVLTSRHVTRHEARFPGHRASFLRPSEQRQRRLRLRTDRRIPRWPGHSHAAPATPAGHTHNRRTGRGISPDPPRPHADSRMRMRSTCPSAERLPAVAYAIVVPPGRQVEPSFCSTAALLSPQSEVFPRLTLASRRFTMRTGPASGRCPVRPCRREASCVPSVGTRPRPVIPAALPSRALPGPVQPDTSGWGRPP